MKFKRILSATAVLIALSLAFYQSDEALDKIIAAAAKFSEAHPQEKIFLHTDKPFYSAGDTIWYKAYAADAAMHQPSSRSGVLYVDLVNEYDSVIVAQKIKLITGLANAQISLPVNIKPGKYTLISYTNWMKNFDDAFFFRKRVVIVNPFTDPGVKFKPGITSAPDMQFFPEGGNLVEGIRSVVAFKATGPGGLSVSLGGFIVDQDNERVIGFETQHLGMGVFPLVPERGKHYTAVIKTSSGSELRYPLPEAVRNGYVMSVNNREKAVLNIRVAMNSGENTGRDLMVVLQQNSIIKHISKFSTLPVNNIQVAKNKLQTGIVQVTLFAGEEPVAERLAFIDHHDFLNLEIVPEKAAYGIREQVNVQVTVKTKDNTPAVGSFSVSVVDESKVNYDELKEDHILSNILLTSDLKGYIEEPGHYFNKSDPEAVKHLDYLMLTQGWRRFTWKNILRGIYPPQVFQAEKDLSFSGRVLTMTDKPIPFSKVILLSSNRGLFSLNTISDAKGDFKFDGLGFPDSTLFVLQARNEKGSRYVKMALDPESFHKHQGERYGSFQFEGYQNYAEHSRLQHDNLYSRYLKDVIQIKEIEIKGERKNPLPYSTNLNGPGRADVVITSKMLEGAFSLTEYVEKYVPGIRNDLGVLYSTRTSVLNGASNQIQFILNGVPVDQQFVSEINVNEVEGMEVLRSAAYTSLYGIDAAGGLIIITTKRPEFRKKETSPGVSLYIPKGYQLEKEFYSPKYPAALAEGRPDLRSTIYWNANLITNSKGEAKMTYYNADGKGSYKIVIQGIDADGNLGYSVKRYIVK